MENYQFVKQISQGTFSDVWLVKCSRTRKKYVLKQIDLHYLPKREQRSAHLEVKLLSTIQHPHIVTYLDSFYNSIGSLFIIMCFCESGDLFSHIRSQNGIHFEEKQIVHWFVQICMALKYIHDKKILHCNLKTKNIFLAKNSRIKVGDFGISKELTAIQEASCPSFGTPYYASPELYLWKHYDEKSDIWALGCCIYEIAALRHAYDAHKIQVLAQKKIETTMSIPEIYSPELSAIISTLLSFDPEKRPTVTELLLKEYIRKHIVILLEDTPRSCSSNSSIYRPEEVQETKYRCNILPHISKDQETMEHYSINKLDNPCIRTVPDINGNGDGNDNSQQRANLSSIDISNDKNSIISENVSSANSTKTYIFSNNINIKNRRLKTGNFKVNPCNNLTVSQYVNNVIEKKRSEYSFEILTSLSCTIKNSRIGSSEIPLVKNPLTKSKFYNGIKPPKSADEHFCYSKTSSTIVKSQSTNSIGNHVKTYEKVDENQYELPLIFDKLKRCQSQNEMNQPVLYDFEPCESKNTLKFSSKEDSNSSVNNMLVNEIMEYNKNTSRDADEKSKLENVLLPKLSKETVIK